ncbi:hypothetical protein MBAV_003559 [Candidatus Magnetobacterium bavaricum]|uniref:Uncharacterized protein n=1 Tax=Candidatus Magnetobacterium bavaricum TaxID=29290 RepID=A0A0F3GQI5_9BACT|nr:hypothetical protein MBAV_003559 [Candidatus Magnetobacterium bavaricum]
MYTITASIIVKKKHNRALNIEARLNIPVLKKYVKKTIVTFESILGPINLIDMLSSTNPITKVQAKAFDMFHLTPR